MKRFKRHSFLAAFLLIAASVAFAQTAKPEEQTSGGAKALQERPKAVPAAASLFQECGKLNFLRGHDLGTGFGPPTDFIDVEVVAKLSNDPPKAFGFQLRQDANGPTRSGMLDLLRDAFNNNWTVCVDYFIMPGKNNGTIIRVALTK